MRWIIGDVHGSLQPLKRLLDLVHEQDASPEFLFVGDFVNRGPDSKGAVDLVLSLPNARSVRGNHDDTFDLILSGQCYAPHHQVAGGIPAFLHFLNYGLDATLTSYGIDLAMIAHVQHRPSEEKLTELLAPIPESHRRFFRSLQPVIEMPDIFIAHAKWDVNTPSGRPDFIAQLGLSERLRHDIIWGRFDDREVMRPKPWSRTGFFGHTPVNIYTGIHRSDQFTPIIADMMVLLDTGCALSSSGRLTAYCVEEKRYVQVTRRAEVVE